MSERDGAWIRVAEDRDKWPALVNAVVNTWVPKIRGISLFTKVVLFSQEESHFVQLVS
jgi:hypothetical protein